MRIGQTIRRSATYGACLWPGLLRLWCEGRWSALVVALGLAAKLNLLLLATFVTPHPPGGIVLGLGWLALCTGWTIGIWRSVRYAQRALPDPGACQDLFIQAQAEYLRGHWFEAEALLDKVLRTDQRDVDAQLMLATLYRRTGRIREARRRLRTLQRKEGAEKWQMEIDRELGNLERRKSSGDSSARAESGADDPAAGEATKAA